MRSLGGRVLSLLYFLAPTLAQNLSDGQVALVRQRLAEGATKSWELGTRAQTLLELDAPSFSVLTPAPNIVPPIIPLNSTANFTLSDVLSIAQSVVSNLSTTSVPADGRPLIDGDGSAADPASIGVAVMLANWTSLPGPNYAQAIEAQVTYLLGGQVPKSSKGAISHRVSEVQLWSDFIYMVPPTLAYYGVVTNNKSMVQEAYTQIKLYRDVLRDDHAKGLWKHIELGSFNDSGHWSTGNGWAAMGMLRVLGTMQDSQFSGSFKNQMKDLGNWAFEIQQAMYPQLQSNNLFRNYADEDNSFSDAASTALMAASVYRLSLLTGKHTHLPDAERSRTTLFSLSNSSSEAASPAATSTSPSSARPSTGTSSSSQISPTATPSPTVFSSAQHFTSDGWLTPVVNPNSFGDEGSDSPEAQAFVLMMQSAWRDWVAAGAVGANGALGRHEGVATWGSVWLALLIVLWI
ncbi:Six-hairpin glycosidase-like protein [Amylostereum chailletii]|nr:Six-hairpin glycosidase-like protein [Amylostereum chailletii]